MQHKEEFMNSHYNKLNNISTNNAELIADGLAGALRRELKILGIEQASFPKDLYTCIVEELIYHIELEDKNSITSFCTRVVKHYRENTNQGLGGLQTLCTYGSNQGNNWPTEMLEIPCKHNEKQTTDSEIQLAFSFYENDSKTLSNTNDFGEINGDDDDE